MQILRCQAIGHIVFKKSFSRVDKWFQALTELRRYRWNYGHRFTVRPCSGLHN